MTSGPPAPLPAGVKPGNLAPTPVLDSRAPAILSLAAQPGAGDPSSRKFIRAAHRGIAEAVQPVYTVDEFQPASVTLRKGRGSCSQRMACLEAVCRARGIPTRVRGLWVAGRFWFPRFRLTRPFIPRRILLAWPQFHVDGQWVDFDEIFGSTSELASLASGGFTNTGETLFEAVAATPVDFLGKSRSCGAVCAPGVDLSGFVVGDAGIFDSRDELFAACGSLQHTLCGRLFERVFGGRKSR